MNPVNGGSFTEDIKVEICAQRRIHICLCVRVQCMWVDSGT